MAERLVGFLEENQTMKKEIKTSVSCVSLYPGDREASGKESFELCFTSVRLFNEPVVSRALLQEKVKDEGR